MPSRLNTRLSTRRQSRIGALISSAAIAFARASSATIDGQTVGNNVPRFPSNSNIKGVWVEETHQNIALYSDDLTNAYWSKTNAVPTADALTVTLYSGQSLVMDKLSDTTTNGAHFAARNPLFTAGQPGCTSVIAKAGELSWIFLYVGTGFAFFNLTTGVVGTVSGCTAFMWAVGPGVYKCAVATASAASAACNIGVSNADNGGAYVGAGGGAYFASINATLKAYPLSDLPTTGSAVTMAAESLTVQTQGLLNPLAGSVIIEQRVNAEAGKAGAISRQYNVWGCGTPGAANSLRFVRASSSSVWTAQVVDNSGTAYSANYPGQIAEGKHFFGFRFGGTSVSLGLDGSIVATKTGAVMPSSLPALAYHGSSGIGTDQMNDVTYRVWYYDHELSDAEFNAATAGNPPPQFTAHVDFTTGQLKVNLGHPWRLAESLSILYDPPDP